MEEKLQTIHGLTLHCSRVNYIWIYHIIFIHSSVEHLGFLHILALIYHTMNICVLVFVQRFICGSFG